MIPELFLQRSHIDFVSMGISLDMVDKWTTIGPNSRPSVFGRSLTELSSLPLIAWATHRIRLFRFGIGDLFK
jgi:hypothetical protein